MIEIYFDGSCIPVNPGGIAGFGAVIYKDGIRYANIEGIVEAPEGLQTTNNLAEYAGFTEGLVFCLNRGWQDEPMMVHGDSNLVIQQMFGTWKIKKGVYTDWAHRAKELLYEFTKINGEWIPREKNKEADFLSKNIVEVYKAKQCEK